MFLNLRERFARSHLFNPKAFLPAPFDEDVFNRTMTARLNAGEVNGLDVIDALEDIKDNLPRVSIMVRARMMGVLSDEIDALREDAPKSGLSVRALRQVRRLKQAGQHLAVHTHVPDDTVEGLHEIGETILADIELDNERKLAQGEELLDGNTAINTKDLRQVLEYFNTRIAERFKVLHGFTTIVIDSNVKRHGSADFNNETELHELETNIRYVKTLRDIPKVAATSLHEGMHMVIADSEKRFKGHEEEFRQSDPSFYVMMRACSRNFYAGKGPLYTALPEEVLAERVGIRFAMRLNEVLNCQIPFDEFMGIVASTISHPSVFKEVERTWSESKPLPYETAFEENHAPAPTEMGFLGKVKHVASVLKANF